LSSFVIGQIGVGSVVFADINAADDRGAGFDCLIPAFQVREVI
jgi:hypothetical protein